MSKLGIASNFKKNEGESQCSSPAPDIRIENGAAELGSFELFPGSNTAKQGNGKKPVNAIFQGLVISHVFLSLMISIILVAPKQVLKLKRVLKHSYTFLKGIIKRVFDIFGALFGLIFSSLLFLFLPIFIRLDSQGDIIFKQKRVGLNRRKKDRRVVSFDVSFERRNTARRERNLFGQPFVLYKFRSMKGDAEKKTGPVWATENDPRVTSVGKILRPLHMDEIPQFINVLRGEMSLVGPRPERPEFVKELNEQVPEYSQRFNGKPGITGLAQVKCGYDTSIDDVSKKLRFDLEYIKGLRLRRDVKILWDTFIKITSKSKFQNGEPVTEVEKIEASVNGTTSEITV